VQLVFCLACLAMAAWTWMRYSYAWDFVCEPDRGAIDILVPTMHPALVDRHVLVKLTPRGEWRKHVVSRAICRIGDERVAFEVTLPPGAPPPTPDAEIISAGRLIVGYPRGPMYLMRPPFLVLDTTASRFHGASVAGLVVGAMGCFIFGLYLRAWLGERKALASQPPQDMIA